MNTVLIIGAKSDIAKSLATLYALKGYNLYLAAKNSDALNEFAEDLRIRTEQEIQTIDLDILDYASHSSFYQSLTTAPQIAVSFIGYLGDQNLAQTDFAESKKIIDTNFTGIVSLLNIIANDFEAKKQGTIIGVSSVAGDRGRKKNYTYGAAKAAFSAYLSGLRNRLHAANVHVMTVKPGFVNTKMTRGMDLPEKLTASADAVAHDIYHAANKKTDIIYTKWIWRWIMLIIKHIPEWKFKRMDI
ncbi:MAG: SDR family oxidoreductase [Gammaproteobacteria bacterium]|nr:SDR family oxidoreductase [Gammaproteobacteria bacterium]